MIDVVFVLVPQLHLLDLAGPAQVFATANDHGGDYRLRYVAEHADIPTWQGVTLRAEVDWPALGADDLIIVPGWRSPTLRTHGHLDDATLERIRGHHQAGGTVASVCSGADALGRAGLLEGRRVTTHHDLQEEMAARYPKTHVVRDVLYCVDGRVVTSAGIASGIDLALHLIATRHGPATASRIARAMVVYARRNGDEPQASAMLRHRGHLFDVVHRVQDEIDSHFVEPLPLGSLAAVGGVSERTLTRLFAHATGLTPLKYQQVLRVERAEHLIGRGDTVESAAHASGFADARMLRRLRSRGVRASQPVV